MDDDSESDDNDISWQVVTSPILKKRRQSESPKIYKNKRQYIENKNSFAINNNYSPPDNTKITSIPNINNNFASTSKQAQINNKTTISSSYNSTSLDSNRFASLDDDTDNNEDNVPKTDNNLPKPPPIFIPNVADISGMINTFSKVIPTSEFSYKSLRNGQIRLMVKYVKPYRIIVTYLNDKKIKFHTYQLKQKRSYRVVVKKLHHSTPISEIKFDIEKNGHKVRSITNILSRLDKEPLPMFYVDLEPDINNKSIYDIKYLNNAAVTIEPPKKTNDIVQCHRCQEFGHTKTYCRKQVNCVKCGLGHLTTECTKDINTPPNVLTVLRIQL